MVDSIGATFQIPGNPGAMGSYITPDALMLYCQSRLQGLDTQMNQIFAQQQRLNNDASKIGELLGNTGLKLPENGDLDNADKTRDKVYLAYEAIAAEKAKLDPSDPLYQKLDDLQTSLGSVDQQGFHVNPNLLGTADHLTSDQFNSLIIGAVNSIQKDLSSGGELNMINLQSIMSQRQQAIQLATNLIQSLGDQCNKVADNVGK